MPGGGTKASVGIHRHDIQIRKGKDLRKGAELVVHQLQKLPGVGDHVGLVVAGAAGIDVFGGIGHGDKVHVLLLQPAKDRRLRKPEDILKAEVRFHIPLENVDQGVDFCHVLELQKLLHHSFQERLLGFDASQVAVRIAVLHIIVMAVPEDLHGVGARQQPVALVLMDMEILEGVVVVHIPGHIEIHAAHGIHNLAHRVPFHHHLEIRLEAHQLGNFLIQALDALLASAVLIVDGIDALDIPGDVHHGVSGDGHHGSFLIGHVVAGQEHGVGIAAASGITAQNQDGPVILAFTLAVASPWPDALAVIDARAGAGISGLAVAAYVWGLAVGTVGQLRAHKQAFPEQHTRQRDGQQHYHHNQDNLLPGGPPLFLPGPFRNPT